jgi:hypothetical protein
MNTTIDFRTLPSNVPSLCIPRVFTNWTESRIRSIFVELCIGDIQCINIVTKNTIKGEKFNRVFVHFNYWFSNKNADIARERLLNGKDIKIIYDDPWFWKVSAYREVVKKSEKYQHIERSRPSPSIQFDDNNLKPRDIVNRVSRPNRMPPNRMPRKAIDIEDSGSKHIPNSNAIKSNNNTELNRNAADDFIKSIIVNKEEVIPITKDLYPIPKKRVIVK